MGAGASALLPAECTKDDARAFAGERWNETMDQKFDAICKDGKISKETVLQHEHSFGLEIRDWRRISEHAHQLTEAAVKEAPEWAQHGWQGTWQRLRASTSFFHLLIFKAFFVTPLLGF